MNKPLRIIEGNAKPHEPFWTFQMAADGAAEIYFDGPISEFSWFGDEITPAAFKADLYGKGKGGPVCIYVNSPGGDVYAAGSIKAMLEEYPGTVTCDITGLCASAATIVAAGADTCRMRESAMYMIHDPSAMAYGNIAELQGVVDVLKEVKCGIVDTYASKTGMPCDQIEALMSAETWMSAKKACEMGFVDEVVSGSTCKPKNDALVGFVNCLSDFAHVPEGVLDELMEEPLPGEDGKAETDLAPVAESEEVMALMERVKIILGK